MLSEYDFSGAIRSHLRVIRKKKLGFTGTRLEPSDRQQKQMVTLLKLHTPAELHHGDCIGADEFIAKLAWELQSKGIRVVCHPPTDEKDRAFTKYHECRDALPYIERNHAIVDECDFLLGVPRTANEEVRSGTWATIRYAWKVGIPVSIFKP